MERDQTGVIKQVKKTAGFFIAPTALILNCSTTHLDCMLMLLCSYNKERVIIQETQLTCFLICLLHS